MTRRYLLRPRYYSYRVNTNSVTVSCRPCSVFLLILLCLPRLLLALWCRIGFTLWKYGGSPILFRKLASVAYRNSLFEAFCSACCQELLQAIRCHHGSHRSPESLPLNGLKLLQKGLPVFTPHGQKRYGKRTGLSGWMVGKKEKPEIYGRRVFVGTAFLHFSQFLFLCSAYRAVFHLHDSSTHRSKDTRTCVANRSSLTGAPGRDNERRRTNAVRLDKL